MKLTILKVVRQCRKCNLLFTKKPAMIWAQDIASGIVL